MIWSYTQLYKLALFVKNIWQVTTWVFLNVGSGSRAWWILPLIIEGDPSTRILNREITHHSSVAILVYIWTGILELMCLSIKLNLRAPRYTQWAPCTKSCYCSGHFEFKVNKNHYHFLPHNLFFVFICTRNHQRSHLKCS